MPLDLKFFGMDKKTQKVIDTCDKALMDAIDAEAEKAWDKYQRLVRVPLYQEEAKILFQGAFRIGFAHGIECMKAFTND